LRRIAGRHSSSTQTAPRPVEAWSTSGSCGQATHLQLQQPGLVRLRRGPFRHRRRSNRFRCGRSRRRLDRGRSGRPPPGLRRWNWRPLPAPPANRRPGSVRPLAHHNARQRESRESRVESREPEERRQTLNLAVGTIRGLPSHFRLTSSCAFLCLLAAIGIIGTATLVPHSESRCSRSLSLKSST